MVHYKNISCPLCKNSTYKIIAKSTLKKDDFDQKTINENLKNTLDDFTKHGQIVRCNSCNLIYINPQENMRKILKGYSEVVDVEYLKMEKFRKILMKNHIKFIKRFKKNGCLLDIGTFCGFFLEISEKNKYKSYGVEPCTWAKKIAKNRKLNILGNTINDIKNKKFDVITLFDVIEHLENPKKELIKIHKILNDDGIIVIGTPNIESFLVKVLKDKHPFFIRMHLILFSKKTLNKILSDTGYEVLGSKYYGRTFPLNYYLEKLEVIMPFARHLNRFLNKSPRISNFSVTLNLHDEMLFVARKKLN